MSNALESLKAILSEKLPDEQVQALMAELAIAVGDGSVAISGDVTGSVTVIGTQDVASDNHRIVVNQGMEPGELVQILRHFLRETQGAKQFSQDRHSLDQTVQQSGKFGVNIGQGEGIHIGDVYQADPETIKRIVREELRLPQREYGDPVGLGLNALVELMQHTEARSAVIAFRVDFQAACEQINIIANYKGLHDLLHTLEFQCYSGIVQESKRFPGDETALDILTDHELTLQKILREVQEVAGRETIATNELLWLKDLEHAQEALHAAIEDLDTRRLQRTIWLLNRVLAIQPSRINTNLNAAARTLRLPALVNAMKAIWERLAGSNLNQEKIRQFQRGVEVLAELNKRLAALVIGHDFWQELDLELRRIEANLEKDSI